MAAAAAAARKSDHESLKDVDMMDVAELEKERGDPNVAGPTQDTLEQEELAKARLQRQALTFEQKCLIEKIVDEKTTVFTHSIQQ